MTKRIAALAAVAAPLLALAAVHGCGGGGIGSGGGDSVLGCRDRARGCPDLKVSKYWLEQQINIEQRSFREGDCAIVEGYVPGPGTFRLLRFTTAFPNIGPGDLIVGSPTHPSNRGLFDWSPCHEHYHLRDFSTYRLWTMSGYSAWRALRDAAPPEVLSSTLLAANPDIAKEMIGGSKRAFCLMDSMRYGGYEGDQRPDQFTDCSRQGITVGWMDVYQWDTEGNWIDITELASGRYMLEIEVNPEHRVMEQGYGNNWAAAEVQI